MLKPRWFVLIIFLHIVFCNETAASLLEDKKNEWSFAYTLTDILDAGTFTTLGFQWQWASSSGRHQVGVLASYAGVSFDDPFLGSDTSALLLGPVYTLNWTPSNSRGTGFIEISGGDVGGEAQDLFEAYGLFAIGGRVFVGDSAAVAIRYFAQNLKGVDFVDDLESVGLAVGISFFTGRRTEFRSDIASPPSPASPSPSGSQPPPSPTASGPPATAGTIGSAAFSTGSLSIDASVPNAEVFIDGNLIGTTPFRQLPLPVGIHMVQVSKKGFKPWRQELMVLPGASASLVVELESASEEK